jgi:hypothetical protein
VYAENGVYLTQAGKGPGSRVQGWQRWHTYLKDGPACPHHRALGWDTCPMIHIFRTCPNLLHELENLPHATTGNVEDADTKAPDHAMDAGRYLLLNLGGGPQFRSTTRQLLACWKRTASRSWSTLACSVAARRTWMPCLNGPRGRGRPAAHPLPRTLSMPAGGYRPAAGMTTEHACGQ